MSDWDNDIHVLYVICSKPVGVAVSIAENSMISLTRTDLISQKALDCAMRLTGVQLVVQFGELSKQVVTLFGEKSVRD